MITNYNNQQDNLTATIGQTEDPAAQEAALKSQVGEMSLFDRVGLAGRISGWVNRLRGARETWGALSTPVDPAYVAKLPELIKQDFPDANDSELDFLSSTVVDATTYSKAKQFVQEHRKDQQLASQSKVAMIGGMITDAVPDLLTNRYIARLAAGAPAGAKRLGAAVALNGAQAVGYEVARQDWNMEESNTGSIGIAAFLGGALGGALDGLDVGAHLAAMRSSKKVADKVTGADKPLLQLEYKPDLSKDVFVVDSNGVASRPPLNEAEINDAFAGLKTQADRIFKGDVEGADRWMAQRRAEILGYAQQTLSEADVGSMLKNLDTDAQKMFQGDTAAADAWKAKRTNELNVYLDTLRKRKTPLTQPEDLAAKAQALYEARDQFAMERAKWLPADDPAMAAVRNKLVQDQLDAVANDWRNFKSVGDDIESPMQAAFRKANKAYDERMAAEVSKEAQLMASLKQGVDAEQQALNNMALRKQAGTEVPPEVMQDAVDSLAQNTAKSTAEAAWADVASGKEAYKSPAVGDMRAKWINAIEEKASGTYVDTGVRLQVDGKYYSPRFESGVDKALATLGASASSALRKVAYDVLRDAFPKEVDSTLEAMAKDYMERFLSRAIKESDVKNPAISRLWDKLNLADYRPLKPQIQEHLTPTVVKEKLDNLQLTPETAKNYIQQDMTFDADGAILGKHVSSASKRVTAQTLGNNFSKLSTENKALGDRMVALVEDYKATHGEAPSLFTARTWLAKETYAREMFDKASEVQAMKAQVEATKAEAAAAVETPVVPADALDPEAALQESFVKKAAIEPDMLHESFPEPVDFDEMSNGTLPDGSKVSLKRVEFNNMAREYWMDSIDTDPAVADVLKRREDAKNALYKQAEDLVYEKLHKPAEERVLKELGEAPDYTQGPAEFKAYMEWGEKAYAIREEMRAAFEKTEDFTRSNALHEEAFKVFDSFGPELKAARTKVALDKPELKQQAFDRAVDRLELNPMNYDKAFGLFTDKLKALDTGEAKVKLPAPKDWNAVGQYPGGSWGEAARKATNKLTHEQSRGVNDAIHNLRSAVAKEAGPVFKTNEEAVDAISKPVKATVNPRVPKGQAGFAVPHLMIPLAAGAALSLAFIDNANANSGAAAGAGGLQVLGLLGGLVMLRGKSLARHLGAAGVSKKLVAKAREAEMLIRKGAKPEYVHAMTGVKVGADGVPEMHIPKEELKDLVDRNGKMTAAGADKLAEMLKVTSPSGEVLKTTVAFDAEATSQAMAHSSLGAGFQRVKMPGFGFEIRIPKMFNILRNRHIVGEDGQGITGKLMNRSMFGSYLAKEGHVQNANDISASFKQTGARLVNKKANIDKVLLKDYYAEKGLKAPKFYDEIFGKTLEEEFQQAITEYRLNPTDPNVLPSVKKASQEQFKLEQEMMGMLHQAHDQTVRKTGKELPEEHPLTVARGIKADEFHVRRTSNKDNITRLVATIGVGKDALIALLEKGLKGADGVTAENARGLAEDYLKKLYSESVTGGVFNISNPEKAAKLEAAMRARKMGDDVIEQMKDIMNLRGEASMVAPLKERVFDKLDMNATHTVTLEDGSSMTIAVKDLFELNSQRVFATWVHPLAGVYAHAVHGLEHGIDWLREANYTAMEELAKSEGYDDVQLKTLRAARDFMLGKALDPTILGSAGDIERVFNGFRTWTLGSEFLFAQIPEHASVFKYLVNNIRAIGPIMRLEKTIKEGAISNLELTQLVDVADNMLNPASASVHMLTDNPVLSAANFMERLNFWGQKMGLMVKAKQVNGLLEMLHAQTAIRKFFTETATTGKGALYDERLWNHFAAKGIDKATAEAMAKKMHDVEMWETDPTTGEKTFIGYDYPKLIKEDIGTYETYMQFLRKHAAAVNSETMGLGEQSTFLSSTIMGRQMSALTQAVQALNQKLQLGIALRDGIILQQWFTSVVFSMFAHIARTYMRFHSNKDELERRLAWQNLAWAGIRNSSLGGLWTTGADLMLNYSGVLPGGISAAVMNRSSGGGYKLATLSALDNVSTAGGALINMMKGNVPTQNEVAALGHIGASILPVSAAIGVISGAFPTQHPKEDNKK